MQLGLISQQPQPTTQDEYVMQIRGRDAVTLCSMQVISLVTRAAEDGHCGSRGAGGWGRSRVAKGWGPG